MVSDCQIVRLHLIHSPADHPKFHFNWVSTKNSFGVLSYGLGVFINIYSFRTFFFSQTKRNSSVNCSTNHHAQMNEILTNVEHNNLTAAFNPFASSHHHNHTTIIPSIMFNPDYEYYEYRIPLNAS